MSNNLYQIYCQKCRTGNPLGQDLCRRCGTRLMLVIEPSNIRHDNSIADAHDGHLLERISILEHRLTRFAEKLEKTLDLLLQHSNQTYLDHTLLETLIEQLSEVGIINNRKLKSDWRNRCETDAVESNKRFRYQSLRTKILSTPPPKGEKVFSSLIDTGINSLEEGNVVDGLQQLERAFLLVRTNITLTLLIVEELLGLRKTALARDYLAQAHKLEPSNPHISMLLGITYAEEAEPGKAKALLEKAIKDGQNSFAAHYSLGRLLAMDGEWDKAIKYFKQALSVHPIPETYFLVGYSYYLLGRFRMALKYLEKAMYEDDEYAEAFYMLGHTYWQQGDTKSSREAFNAAVNCDPNNKRYMAALQAIKRMKAPVFQPLPIFGSTGRRKKYLLSGGDSRLCELLWMDILMGFSDKV
jgi:tetratricopeptide (TPR) repeat protein